MKVIVFMEKPAVIKRILKHLGLWHVKRKPQLLAHAPPVHTISLLLIQVGFREKLQNRIQQVSLVNWF